MKNVTLAIDETVLAAARQYATKHNTTVNGLVRDYLTRLAAQEDRAANARRRLVELARESTWDPGADWKWNREEIYESRQLPRHEHSTLRGFEEPGASSKKDKSD